MMMRHWPQNGVGLRFYAFDNGYPAVNFRDRMRRRSEMLTSLPNLAPMTSALIAGAYLTAGYEYV